MDSFGPYTLFLNESEFTKNLLYSIDFDNKYFNLLYSIVD